MMYIPESEMHLDNWPAPNDEWHYVANDELNDEFLVRALNLGLNWNGDIQVYE